jgi:indole-3-glycerol phosphate synthase
VSADFLATMAASSRARTEAARRVQPAAELDARIAGLAAPPPLRRTGGFGLIAELKLRSPAVGALSGSEAEADVAARVAQYAAAGAAAVSVLTEPTRFDGALAHLQEAAATLAARGVPAMRKDFLVDPYQVLEARAAGAGGVLVILRMLGRPALEALIDSALEQALFVLLEAFDAADLRLAQELVAARSTRAAQLLVGVNCRDLTTLQVVPGRLEALAPMLAGAFPPEVARVAESGVASAADAARVAAAGYDLALVGSALMTGPDPAALAAAMLAAGRGARRSAPGLTPPRREAGR